MSQQNTYLFLESFKRVEQLCNQLYTCHNGVSEYIEHMRSAPYHARNIHGWDNDLMMLKYLRHLRNQLTHEPGAFERLAITKEDIDWLELFRKRILNATDPLALLHQKISAFIPPPPPPSYSHDNAPPVSYRYNDTPQPSYPSPQPNGHSTLILLLTALLIPFLLYLIITIVTYFQA